MEDLYLKYVSVYPSSAQMLENFRRFVVGSGKDVLSMRQEDVSKYRDHLLASFSPAESAENLVVVSSFYKYISRRAFWLQFFKNVGIIILQAIAIYTSSVWIVPKYQWPTFLWLDQISIWLFGSVKIFYLPGFVGTLVALAVLLILLARGWLERPRNWLGWIVLLLDWWILAVLYGLIVGDEAAFLSGGLNTYLIIAAFTAFVLGFKEIVGLAFILLMVLAGFRISTVSSVIMGMSFPYLVSLTLLIFAQSPEAFDRILGWINRQFLTGRVQAASADISRSVAKAAKQIQIASGQIVDKLFMPGKTKMF